jgi:hypothetical protein
MWLVLKQNAGPLNMARRKGGQPQSQSMSEFWRAWNWNEMERNGSFEGL